VEISDEGGGVEAFMTISDDCR